METIEYLDDKISIYQDDELYKFTSDAIMLSRFATVKKGDIVGDFCSGSGVVGFNLFGENKDKISSVTFFEMQKPLFDLSMKSIERNNLSEIFSGVNTKVQDIDNSYAGKFSLIVCNPPYMPYGHGFHEENLNIAVCRTEIELPLEELLKSISKTLKYGGRVAMVHRADRLADVVMYMKKYGIEPKRLQPVTGDIKKDPYLILVEGVKGGKSGIKILKTAVN